MLDTGVKGSHRIYCSHIFKLTLFWGDSWVLSVQNSCWKFWKLLQREGSQVRQSFWRHFDDSQNCFGLIGAYVHLPTFPQFLSEVIWSPSAHRMAVKWQRCTQLLWICTQQTELAEDHMLEWHKEPDGFIFPDKTPRGLWLIHRYHFDLWRLCGNNLESFRRDLNDVWGRSSG